MDFSASKKIAAIKLIGEILGSPDKFKEDLHLDSYQEEKDHAHLVLTIKGSLLQLVRDFVR